MAAPSNTSGDPDAESVGRIKGIAFREFLVWYGQRYGAESLMDAAEALSAEHARAFTPQAETLGVLASKWYPGETVWALLDELTRGRSPTEQAEMARQGADAVMKATLRGVYRLLFEWIANPQRYARYAGKLWRSFYDSGSLEIVESGPRAARSIVRDWRVHHPFICELNREASRAIYAAMGCSDARCERVSCVSDGDEVCTFVTSWKP